MLTNLLEPAHIFLILLIALIVFGPKRLPELGKGLGGALREFRRGTQGMKDEFEQAFQNEKTEPVELTAGNTPATPPIPANQGVPQKTEA